MSLAETFDNFAVGSAVPLGGVFAATPDVTRQIVNGGRKGGKALALTTTAAPTDRTIRVGTERPSTGRSPYVRLGFSVFLPSGGASFIANGSPTTIGSVLWDLRVSAEKRLNPDAGYAYDAFGRILSYDVTTGLLDRLALSPDGSQVDGLIAGLYPYRKIVCTCGINSEGYLRVVKELEFFHAPTPLASYSSKRVPLGTWAHLEFLVFMGTPGGTDGFVKAWIDGEITIDVTGFNFATNATMAPFYFTEGGLNNTFLPYPRSNNGDNIYNADSVGFCDVGIYNDFGISIATENSPRIDDLYVLADEPASPDVPFGDIEVIPLSVIANGAVQQSAIGGDTPAATHWQSVTSDDGDATLVEMGPSNLDEYAVDPVDSGRIVKAVRVVAIAKKSDAGVAALTVTTTDGVDGTAMTPSDIDAIDDYQVVSSTFPTAPDESAWTPALVNALDISVRRSR